MYSWRASRRTTVRGVHRFVGVSVSLALVATAIVAVRSQEKPRPADWRYFGGSKAFTRYSPLDQINRARARS
jgi:hypothetical protein